MSLTATFGIFRVRVWPGDGRAEVTRSGTMMHVVTSRAHARALTAFWDRQVTRDAEAMLLALDWIAHRIEGAAR